MTVKELEEKIRTTKEIKVKFNEKIEEYPCYFTSGMIATIDGEYTKSEGVFLNFDDTNYKDYNQQLKINDSRNMQFNNRYHFCVGGYKDEIDCFEII